MAKGKDLSLGELETLYKRKVKYWTDQRAGLMTQLAKCDQQLLAFEEKLRWVRNLISSPEDATLPQPPAGKKRRRKSPVRELTSQVLRKRRGQWLTARQIFTAIRKDTNKRVSRQSINVNLNQLERAGKIRRQRAPKGSGGAHYVYTAV